MKLKKIFIIRPVRSIDVEFNEEINEYANRLTTQGHEVYDPMVDTKQDDPEGGYWICVDNRKAIQEADEVHIAWNGQSEGCLFDMGMAFAFGKTIKLIPNCFPSPDPRLKKSFAHMAYRWAEE